MKRYALEVTIAADGRPYTELPFQGALESR
jgi:hypothetical protein